jgi:nucleotide-binding universal stress UspA family protein
MDGSLKSKAGLEHALTNYSDEAITVLHVLAPYDQWGDQDPPLSTEVADEWYDIANQQAEEIFKEAKELAESNGVDISTALEVGEAWRTIVDYAAQHDIDHIIMGSHGRPDESSIPIGSVAETVVSRSPVLVSVVR